jgi:hypothetical protein
MKRKSFKIVRGLCLTGAAILGALLALSTCSTEPKFKVGDCVILETPRISGEVGTVVEITNELIFIRYRDKPDRMYISFKAAKGVYKISDGWCME